MAAADTNFHKTRVLVLGFIVSVLWLVWSREALLETDSLPSKQIKPARTRILVCLPLLFVVGWLFSAVVHAWLCGYPIPVAPGPASAS